MDEDYVVFVCGYGQAGQCKYLFPWEAEFRCLRHRDNHDACLRVAKALAFAQMADQKSAGPSAERSNLIN